MVAGSLSMGLCLAERYRPELVFIDLGVANVQAFDACHVLASLSTKCAAPMPGHRRDGDRDRRGSRSPR